MKNSFYFICEFFYSSRQSEVIAKDSRRMKHLFIVKKGSLSIWKRLQPNGHNPEIIKTNAEGIENEKCSEFS